MYDGVIAGKLVYHGPREEILPFFESQGMKCPDRKADSDFLQEVTSRKDQQVQHIVTCAVAFTSLADQSNASACEYVSCGISHMQTRICGLRASACICD